MLTLSPNFTHAGAHSLTLSVSDGTATVQGTFPLTVTNVNRAPVLTATSDVVMNAGATQLITLTATDPDGDSISFSASGLPSWASLIASVITLSPTAATAPFDVTVTASDGSLSATDVFSVTVNPPPNQAPTSNNLAQVDGSGATLAPGATVTQSPRVRTSVDDPENGLVQLEVEVVASTASFTGVATQTGSLTAEGTLELALNSLAPGNWKWRARAVDAAGAASAWSAFNSGNTAFTVAPATVSGSIVIASGAAAVNDGAVTLTLSASSTGGAITAMAFSNDGTSFSSPEPYATTRANWQLSPGDGTKTVHVRFTDALGNSATRNDSIILDATPPVLSGFTINANAAATANTSATLTYTASDTGSGIVNQTAANDAVTFTNILPSPAPWTLAGGDGLKLVTLRVTDGAGNTTTRTDVIDLDTVAPIISGVGLNGGVPYTRNGQIPVTVTATDSGTGTTEVCFAGSVASASCVPWGSGGPWLVTLSPGEGLKTVNVTVRDAAANTSTPSSATIRLDTTAPTGTVVINPGNPAYTNQAQVTLQLAPSNDPSLIAGHCSRTAVLPAPAANDPCFVSLSNDTLTLPAGDGAKTVYTYYSDLAGNVSVVTTDTITLDQTAPLISSAQIANGATHTTVLTNLFPLTASDATSGLATVCTGSVSPPTDCGTWSASPTVTLTAGDGLKTGYVLVRDGAGNSSLVSSDTITLDQTVPTLTAFSLADGAAYTNSTTVSVTLTASDATQVEFSTNGGASWGTPVPWQPTSTTISGGDGPKTVHARVRDAAGNQSTPRFDDVLLDQTAPAAPTFTLMGQEGSAVATKQSNVLVTLTLPEPLAPAGNSSGLQAMCVRERASSAAPAPAPLPFAACFSTIYTSFQFALTAEGSRSLDIWLVDRAGNVSSAAGTASIVYDTTPPPQVAGATLVPGHRSLRVSWSAVTDAAGGAGVQSYYVWASRTSGGPWDRLTVIDAPTTTATLTLANENTFYVIVAAVDAAGNMGLQSAELSGTPHFPYTETQRFPSTEQALQAAGTGPGASSRTFLGGTNGQFWSSTELSTFTRVDAMTDGHLTAIEGDPNYVLTVGARGHVSYSVDGLEFRLATNSDPALPKRDLADVTYAGGTATDTWRVAVGSGGLILRAARSSAAPGAVPAFAPVSSGTTQDLKAVASCSNVSANCSSGAVVVALGLNGVILRSTDRGATWAPVAAPAGFTSAAFSKLIHLPGTDTFVAGAVSSFSGTTSLIISTNGGASFSPLTTTPSTVQPIRALTWESTSVPVRLASGSGSTAQLARLTNLSGTSATYTADTFPNLPSGLYHALARGAGTGGQSVAVGASANVLRVNAGGAAWAFANQGVTSSWTTLATPKSVAGPVFAIASATNLMRSTSSLFPVWVSISPAMPAFVPLGAAMPNASTLFVVGSNGTIVRSTNANAAGTPTFTAMTSNTTQSLSSVSCTSTTNCIASGSSGTLLSWNGATWSVIALATPTTSSFSNVTTFMDGATARAIAVGSGGRVYLLPSATPAQSGIPSSESLSDVAAHANVAIAVGNTGIFRSADDGQTWTRVHTLGANSVEHLAGATFIALSSSITYRSTDDGLTWTAVPGTLTGSQELVSCTPQVAGGVTRIVVGGLGGTLLHSLNGGNGG